MNDKFSKKLDYVSFSVTLGLVLNNKSIINIKNHLYFNIFYFILSEHIYNLQLKLFVSVFEELLQLIKIWLAIFGTIEIWVRYTVTEPII